MSSYTNLLRSLNPSEGSETHERLRKLQELEEMRKNREAKRQQRLAGGSEDATSSRARRFRTANQDYSGGITSLSSRRGLPRSNSENEETFRGFTIPDFGGARPKFGAGTTSSSVDEGEDLADMFSSITESMIGKSRSGSSDSGSSYSYRSRVGNDSNTLGQKYERPYYTSERTTDYERPYFTRSISDTRANTGFDSDERTSRWKERRMERERERQQRLAGIEQNYEFIPYNPDDRHQEQEEGVNHGVHHEGYHDYEEGEEPKHFIERLKQGNGETNGHLHSKRGANNDYIISTMPSVPPLKRQRPGGMGDVPDLVQPSDDDDIMAVAKDIRATFGIQSPKSGESSANDDTKHFDFNSAHNDKDMNSNGDFVFTATHPGPRSRLSSAKRRSLRQNGKNLRHSNEKLSSAGQEYEPESVIDANCSVEYEIIEAEDDPEDEEGKVLPISDNFNMSAWAVGDLSEGELDQMNEFFTGDSVNGDPIIQGELNGNRVKEFLDKSPRTPSVKTPAKQKGALSTVKSALNNLVQFDSSGSNKSNSSKETTPEREVGSGDKKARTSTPKTTPKTSGKGKATPKTKKNDVGKHKTVEKVKKNYKSSDSDNETFQTASESENSRKSSRATTPTRQSGPKVSSKNKDKAAMDLTLSDKLAKLETLTQEKSRKQSFSSDTDGQKTVPSYMKSTGASSKKTRSKSPATELRSKSPSGLRSKSPAGLAKDVRDLKKFVQDHTDPEKVTHVHTPKKSEQTNGVVTKSPKARVVKEISTQTDIKMEDTIIKVYVCMHCGKSSDENIGSPEFEFHTDGEDAESVERYETRSETGLKIRSVKPKQPRPTTPKFYSKNESRKSPANSRGYMRGTTSSLLKKGNEKTEKVRKSSVPDILYKSDDSSKKPKSIVAQRAKELEDAAKKGEQKRSACTNRANSVERSKVFGNEKSKLAKSKSVDAMFVTGGKPEITSVEIDVEVPNTDINSNDISKPLDDRDTSIMNNGHSSPEVKDSKPQMIQATPVKEMPKPVTLKSELTSTPKSHKPPPVAPKPKKKIDKEMVEKGNNDTVTTDIKKVEKESTENVVGDTDEVFDEKVESKGQFTRLENNPFIKNDSQRVQRKNSFKKEGESVWEKSESRSTSSMESPHRDSPVRRSHSSAGGERGSLTQLNWSDSGSSESLHKSKSSHAGSRSSSLHGSYESLNKSPVQIKRTPSISSITSQNSMLNLLSPVATTRHPVTGALETDVDAAYNNDHIDTSVEHNEETVDKAHLEFAKNALNVLEFETKKRDSSNESEKDSSQVKNKTIQNGHENASAVNEQTNQNQNRNNSKGKSKGKKGFFKGKMFRK